METSFFQYCGSVFFVIAILHTFLVGSIRKFSHRYAHGSFNERALHLLSEVEVVFGFWGLLFLASLVFGIGSSETVTYLGSLHFNESLFVFVILTLCASRPILRATGQLIAKVASFLPFSEGIAFLLVAMIVGPLLGSLITEPAAMTVTALLLLNRYFTKATLPVACKAALLGLLFVNISIGGTLTPFAAPPILMVAGTWGWNIPFMLEHFGYKGALACALSTAIVLYRFRKDLAKIHFRDISDDRLKPRDLAMIAAHLLFLVIVVIGSHQPAIFLSAFVVFIIFWKLTRNFQDPLAWQQGALVAFFLAGLVVLGGPQTWWLKPILLKLSSLPLYLGCVGLTAIVDNAAITYLGAQVSELSLDSRYALVAGAVVGGGLSVIANAPNPIGYSILGSKIGKNGISAGQILISAFVPTLIAGLCFWLLP